MRKLAILLSLICLLYAAPALGEVYTDMVSLSQAVAAAKKDATFTIGADLIADPEDCIIRNTSKAVITLDGQGHYVDYFLFTDGAFEVVNMEVDLCVLTSQKKNNTVTLTLGADAKVGTVGFDGDAAGHLTLRNAGFVRRAVSNGTAAAVTIENTGLIEGPSGLQVMDQRMVNYK
ncbi:MAG: hypothetical protein IJ461_05295, partial [Clostridia bacterium]|nr:hypothetical protein [Clostridia bacterium]